jgi:hypothetical protein
LATPSPAPTPATPANDAGTTTTYITATLHEVATALTTLTNEPHPLAEP